VGVQYSSDGSKKIISERRWRPLIIKPALVGGYITEGEFSMKKLFGLIWFFCAINGFAQTWTEIENNSGRTPKECTVITKEQWDRLIRQYGEDYGCDFIYLDSTDVRPPSSVNGYYYLRLKRHIDFMGYKFDVPGLAYGNTATGRMEIFYSDSFHNEMGTPEYTTLYNRYVRRVNGE
jgi:hypothetical protein